MVNGGTRSSEQKKLSVAYCDSCGLCCRLIMGIPELVFFDRGDGVCRHLTDANLCEIYDSRPEVCSIDKMYARFAEDMTPEEYYDLMARSCQYLKEHFSELKARQEERQK